MNFLVQCKPIRSEWLDSWCYKFEYYDFSTNKRTFITSKGNLCTGTLIDGYRDAYNKVQRCDV